MDAEERTIYFRRRPDLVTVPNRSGGEAAWVVKDPLTLRYYQLRAEEYAVLELLDGRSSLIDLLERLTARFPGHRLTAANVGQFVTSLLKSGLLASTGIGYGRRMADASWQRRQRAWIAKLGSLMSIRFRGIDAEPLLKLIQPFTRVLLSKSVLTGLCFLIASAVVVVVGRLEEIGQRLPDVASFVTPANIPFIAITFILIKVLHELGHAIACKHFDGECHEIGFILIAFMPLLYCNVTDSWMSARKWPRIAVSLAGMFVELTLAAICTFLWLASVPGPANSFFLNVMLICSINTLLFNGNPLLRYDGYYVLSDLTGMPNLSGESREVVWTTFDRWVLGIDNGQYDYHPPTRRWLLFTYGIASSVYRWIVLVGIVWFLHHTLAGLGLGVLSVVFAGPAVVISIGMLFARLVGRVRGVAAQRGKTRTRAATGFLAFLTALGLIVFIPFPFYVYAPFVVRPPVDSAVFVNAAGRLEEAIESGARVQKGEVLAKLNSLQLKLQLEEHEQELAQLDLRLAHLNAQRGLDNSIAARIPSTQEARNSAAKRVERLARQAESLVVRSERSGVVFPPPNVTRPAEATKDVRLWTGTPLDRRNHDAFLDEQTIVCHVCEPTDVEAVIYIDQDLAEFIVSGLAVEFQLRSAPMVRFSGEIKTVATLGGKEPNREILAAGLMPPRTETTATSYQARAAISTKDWTGTVYAPGTARIRAGSMSLAGRASRAIRRIFATEL
ncbi:MAG: hypothetical protein AB8G99_11100 [Planctomycetaceae bacterium]